MTRIGAIAASLGGLAVAISICAACDKTPTRPAPPLLIPNGKPVLTRVEISGPDTIAPGTRVTYTLTGFFSDGTSRDVTAQAVWRSTNEAAAAIDQSGVATGGSTGDTLISGAIPPYGSAKSVAVAPPGTFRLLGSVVEEVSNLRISSAEVEVRGATGLLTRTTTGFDGSFRLLGVPADAELRVTHDGYVAHTQRLQLSEQTTVQVTLKLAAPVADVSGSYTMTIAVSECPNLNPAPLIDEFRLRTYTAIVTQVGSTIHVTLAGPRIVGVFTGRVLGGRASFVLKGFESLPYTYYSTDVPDVVEWLPDSTVLVPSGNADLTASANRWDGTLKGSMTHMAFVPNGRILGRCSGSMSLTFAR